MTKREFVKICQKCGYASRKFAWKYALERDKLTEEDFQNIYRMNRSYKEPLLGEWSGIEPAEHGDDLIEQLGEVPYPWQHDITDCNRARPDEMVDLDLEAITGYDPENRG